jgi:O-acetyl-ADP-ribose deacetylase (regulator of RNase III)
MKIVKGDLLKLAQEGQFDVIVHGCNCFNNMGAGIARSIKQEYPAAYKADQATTKGDQSKLGTYTAATIDKDGRSLVVVNAYTQYNFTGPMPRVDYDAMKSVFAALKRDFPGRRIGYPKIGAGLAGGDWNRISAIIDECLAGEDHTVVEFSES